MEAIHTTMENLFKEATEARAASLVIVGQIEPHPIDQLIPYASNARIHSEAQIEQIAQSIREFGFVNPILVGIDHIIIAGHARLLAARKLGMSVVPVIVLAHLSETQRRALVIADNQLALNAGWNDETLRAQLAALNQQEFDLKVLGFDDRELERLLANEGLHDGLTDPDAVPALPPTPVTVPGDLWLLGGHRLLCADATQREAIDRVLAGQQG
jgi:ParB-like chromosome segregation protein Spo0J